MGTGAVAEEEEEEEADDGDDSGGGGKLPPPPFLKSIGRYRKSNLPATPGVACSVSSSVACERRLGTFFSIRVVIIF